MSQNKPKIIAIVGPTASGKTAVAVKLAKKFSGEIVSADSRQIFRGLDLGTGKDLSEYDGVRYHLIDILNPGESFNLFKYVELARGTIEGILKRKKLPIIVGGTGLYIQALVEGFALEQRNKSEKTKKSLKDDLNKKSVEELQSLLNYIDPEALGKLSDKKNPHRLIRAIERAEEGYAMAKKQPAWEVLQIGLDRPREELNERIDKRVDERFSQGMLEEVANLLQNGVNPEWLLKLGLEYKIITDFVISNFQFPISKQIPKTQLKNIQTTSEFEQMKNLLKLRSHQYAKRQMTWFKRFPEILWENDYSKIEEKVKGFLMK